MYFKLLSSWEICFRTTTIILIHKANLQDKNYIKRKLMNNKLYLRQNWSVYKHTKLKIIKSSVLTDLTSSKLSSYCPATSLTITRLLVFLCFFELLILDRVLVENLLELTKQELNSNDPGLGRLCFLVNEFIWFDTKESKHKQGPVCVSTIDEPTTDKAPTIFPKKLQNQENQIFQV